MNEKSAGKCGWHLGRMYRSWPVKCATIAVGLWSLCLSQAGALEFTADQITKINGKTQKANIYYRDNMWRIEHHTMARSMSVSSARTNSWCGCCCRG